MSELLSLVLGDGDVVVGSGLCNALDQLCGCMVFSASEPKEIGTILDHDYIDEVDPMFQILFKKPESVDVVIEGLLEVKAQMLKKLEEVECTT